MRAEYTSPLLYFPVKPEPLRMAPNLLSFPYNFGNGAADTLFTQVDTQLHQARALKAAAASGAPRLRYYDAAHSAEEQLALVSVVAWLEATVLREHPEFEGDLGRASRERPRFEALGLILQEDLAILHRGTSGGGRMIAAHISFPSGWRPERLRGADFMAIHDPVPGFPGADHAPREKREAVAKSMVTAMIERGPYVRFVWTVSADPHLDHHPLGTTREPWSDASSGYFRVERQITVPFPDASASLFLIRTYVHPFAKLSREQNHTLQEAIRVMPEEVASYKGLLQPQTAILNALQRSAAERSNQGPP